MIETERQTRPVTGVSFGCRLNATELDVMLATAEACGLDATIVINTCAVTRDAVRQGQQAIRRLRRERPDARMIVTGCATETAHAAFAAMPEVDHVLGNGDKTAPHVFAELAHGHAPRALGRPAAAATLLTSSAVAVRPANPRAYVQVQNGCDHRCTFCIIPFGRGPSRSLDPDLVVAEVRRLVDLGTPEIVLTGVDLTAYGHDLAPRVTLGAMVRRVLDGVPRLDRLRLSSIDQVEVDDDLIDVITGEPRLMPHLHLSLQSGADLILKRMRRRHCRRDAIAFTERLLRRRSDLVFGADLIVGFPTETDAHFADTLALIDDCQLTYLHVFPYSARAGTPAARMPQVAPAVSRDRAARLRAAGATARTRYLDREVGAVRPVLIERPGRARTPGFAEVDVDPALQRGSVQSVRLIGHDGTRLKGMTAA
jgi:threonylcarbamoyladenosine tRNA methylthiotransferase MtaB